MKKILLVADQPGWIFDDHCHEIQKRLKGEFDIQVAYRRNHIQKIAEEKDLVYVLDPMAMKSWAPPNKTIMGLRCEFMFLQHPQGAKGLYEKGLAGFGSSIKNKCCIFHVVNQNQIDVFKPIVLDKPLLLVPHGVNEEIFDASKYKKVENDVLTISTSGRGSPNKGFPMVKKACDDLGIRYISAQFGNKKVPKEEMPEFYNKVDAHVCMSRHEGLSNPIMEAGAMGVPVISTKCGASEEMIVDKENGLLIDRTEEALKEALAFMRDNKEKRLEMGQKFYEEIMKNWTWKSRIDGFRKMFNLFFNGK